MLCNSELRSFQQHLAEFERRGVRVVAISVDAPDESLPLAKSQGYTFPLLSDVNAAAIRAYRVLHAGGGENGKDIARPAEFLVDKNGTVQWENLTENLLARLEPQTVLAVFDRTVPQR